jgi:NAD(P)H-flavin reductase
MQERTGKILEKNFLTPNILELVLEVEEDFNFTPGQFVQFIVGEKVMRSYSITSLPKDLPILKFLIHLEDGGVGSEFIRDKKIGEEILFRGPAGIFTWKDKIKPTVFVATGVGLAPFCSMIADGVSEAQKCVLLFGTREPHALFYKKQFEDFEINHHNFSYLPTLSGAAQDWKGSRGRVTDYLPDLVKGLPDAQYFLCGNQKVVVDCRKLLMDLGVENRAIKIEIF